VYAAADTGPTVPGDGRLAPPSAES
jgi:hypothetical protein